MVKSFSTLLAPIAIVLILVSIACSMPIMPFTQSGLQTGPQVVAQYIITADPNATATATPFQPVGPTATALPTVTMTPTSTPTPEPTSTTNPLDELAEQVGLPTPVRVGSNLPKEIVNLLLLGSDFRPSSGYRTDVIMLVSINTEKGTVSVTSFPRDLYVFIPGWMTQRINTAHPHGGFSMMQDTFEFNFGVRPEYYVLTNFQGFTGIINSLGGIDVNVGSYLSDKCDLPWQSNGYCSVSPGVMRMDGDTALWYVRSRYTSSDFDRTRRAQEVMLGLFYRLMSLDAVKRLPELYSSYSSSVETNMDVQAMIPLLPVASQIMADNNRISRYAIGPGEVWPYMTEGGASVLLPNYDAIAAIIQKALYGP